MKIKWRQQLQCRELRMARWSDGRVPILIILKFAVDVRAVAAVQHEKHRSPMAVVLDDHILCFCCCILPVSSTLFLLSLMILINDCPIKVRADRDLAVIVIFDSNCSCRSSSSMLHIQTNADTVHAYISFSVILPRLISVVRNGCRFSGIAESVMLLVLLQKKKMGQHRLIPQPVYLYR